MFLFFFKASLTPLSSPARPVFFFPPFFKGQFFFPSRGGRVLLFVTSPYRSSFFFAGGVAERVAVEQLSPGLREVMRRVDILPGPLLAPSTTLWIQPSPSHFPPSKL